MEFKRKIKKRRKKIKAYERKIRKIKLIKLGTLFLITDLLEEKQETILGYLTKFNENEDLITKGTFLLNTKGKIDYPANENRKILFYKMIRKSALLEKLNIHLKNPKAIIGYLDGYKYLSKEDKLVFFKIGKSIFKKNFQNFDNKITDLQKIELLKICINKKIDFNNLIKKLNIKTTIHDLTYNCYNKLKEELDKI